MVTTNRGISCFPRYTNHIARASKKAHTCSSIDSQTAATLMARTVLEASAKEKQILKGNLCEKIDALREAGGRVSGGCPCDSSPRKTKAHSDIANEVKAQDAEDVLSLIDQLLHEIFQSVAVIERIRSRSEASARSQ
ncbi:DUF4145 domain-containing protein [Rathayibacter sp. VKM Ac-2928]|uniref:DUF4145 domain-containing protein n=1 Tax=Rathayibacter sp. VKM Ac-2928 TaxID=2929479 RepID=UPI001FB51CC5|nr:DUF4145 domain-containing protein [Rathayibacter sp. VKM Ac-2928]MCJ1682598.1 DUF4145 domain-containing protein [Rathayibacter sp. VKM Ac-2928]